MPQSTKGSRRPERNRLLSDSVPKKGSRNRASTLSAAMMAPDQVSFMWKVLVKIRGMTLLYICQKAQMEKNAKPMHTVRL